MVLHEIHQTVYRSGMEKLKTYLLQMSVDDRVAFASRCGTTWPFLRNVAYGYRSPGEKLCVSIERESTQLVTRRDLRPNDWHEIWPELAEQETRHA